MSFDELATWIARATGARSVEPGERIQSLWSGYGELSRVRLFGADAPSAVLKWARPPSIDTRGDASQARKRRSYDVEIAFYRRLAPHCDASCRVPRLYDARIADGQWWLLLEDLDAAGLARRTRDPRGPALEACLAWLASFHARFLGERPDGLWPVGTYWHLDTRRDELAKIHDEAIRDSAGALDQALRDARFQSIVHGDAKPANFCFSEDGARVGAVDFQYVGGGPGVRDVAYLLHGAGSGRDEARGLGLYFERLREALPSDVDARAVEAEWRGLYGVAKRDFERFLAGWRG